ncbi:MAG: hypothetical protein BJ554DRAFT_3681 [Olpidium bornovanus]|uniref:Uncharacterized protein n=1 Tax=Olpidium bornovanus TaxID=278681 RepID=A0A8H7ZNT2_9FUNG|nr:MAG: hypothetical protein BJ554DRAFT_3681 [Olpidium bornovanus]
MSDASSSGAPRSPSAPAAAAADGEGPVCRGGGAGGTMFSRPSAAGADASAGVRVVSSRGGGSAALVFPPEGLYVDLRDVVASPPRRWPRDDAGGGGGVRGGGGDDRSIDSGEQVGRGDGFCLVDQDFVKGAQEGTPGTRRETALSARARMRRKKWPREAGDPGERRGRGVSWAGTWREAGFSRRDRG